MQVLEQNRIDLESLREMKDDRLAKMGVRMVDRAHVILKCVKCEKRWSPESDSSGKLVYEWWVCPSRCNHK